MPQSPISRTRAGASPNEAALVRRVHRAVGGPTALAAYRDAPAVRGAVLRALIAEQTSAAGAARVARGDLTPLERRVLRTVTNRGAAVRSRARQHEELERLRRELAKRDATIAALQARVAKVPPPTPLQPTPLQPTPTPQPPAKQEATVAPPGPPADEEDAPPEICPCGLICADGSVDSLPRVPPPFLSGSLDRCGFGAFADPLGEFGVMCLSPMSSEGSGESL